MKAKLGFQAVIYRNSASYDTPTWDEVTDISDLNLTPAMEEADSTARGQGGLGTSEPTILRIEISGKIRDGSPANADYTAFQNAFYGRSALDLLVLDGPRTVVGSTGVRADFKLFNWAQDQSLATALFNDFSLKPCVGNTAQRAEVTEVESVATLTLTNITSVAS